MSEYQDRLEAWTPKSIPIDECEGPLLPVPKDYEPMWKRVSQSKLGDRMRRAIYLVIQGSSISAAARALGYESATGLSQHLHGYGIAGSNTPYQIQLSQRLAQLSGEELERRMAAGDFSLLKNAELINMRKAEMDQISKFEGWNRPQAEEKKDLVDVFTELAAKLGGGGRNVKLELVVEKSAKHFGPVDITPELGPPVIDLGPLDAKLGPPDDITPPSSVHSNSSSVHLIELGVSQPTPPECETPAAAPEARGSAAVEVVPPSDPSAPIVETLLKVTE